MHFIIIHTVYRGMACSCSCACEQCLKFRPNVYKSNESHALCNLCLYTLCNLCLHALCNLCLHTLFNVCLHTLLLLLLLCFTTQVVEARGNERPKKKRREVKYIDCADGLKA